MRLRKGIQRTTAFLTAALLLFGTTAARGAGETEAVSEAGQTETAQPEEISEIAAECAQPEIAGAEENPETVETEPAQMEEPPEAGQKMPEAGQETPENGHETPENGQETSETGQETSGAGQETPENGQETSEAGQNEPKAEQETPGAEPGESVLSQEAGQPEPAPQPETEQTALSLVFEARDAHGEALPVSEMEVPGKLTSRGVTRAVDYRDGVYLAEVPAGEQSVCLNIGGLPEDSTVEFSRWNGYLSETEESWLLYPDDAPEDAVVRRGNTFELEWEKFAVDQEELTLEQMDVYGALDENCDYAEVLVSGKDLSLLFLFERGQESGLQEETSEPETTAPEVSSEETEAEASSGETEAELSPGEVKSETEAPEFLVEEPESETASGETEAASEGSEAAESAELSDNYGIMPVLAAAPQKVENVYKAAGKNLADSAARYTPQVSSTNGEWQILGLARSGQKVDASLYSKYVANVINTLKKNNGVLDERKYTEYSRVILALTALGEDVTNIGGYNLLAPLADFDQTVWQGINGPIFALIAFDSHNYEIPAAPAGKTQSTRENLIAVILAKEISGGGWTLSGNEADADMTAMALQALAPYREKDSAVKAAVERGVAKLSAMQRSDGGYGSWNTANSESCSQVVVALTALGIDPATDARFIKNGYSVVDALLGFSNSDGSFAHEQKGDGDQMATEQAYYALTSYYRFQEGKTSLYDMSDVALKSDREKAAQADALLAALPDKVTLEDKEQIQAAQTLYDSLTDAQKALLSAENVKKLQNAADALAKLEKASGGSGNNGQNSGSNKSGGNSGNSGKKTSSAKKPTGSTKQVNLTSGTGGSGAGTKTTVMTGGSSAKKAGESGKESESESETEDAGQTAKGGTMATAQTRAALAAIRKLFRKSGDGMALPETAEEYTDEQVQAIVDIYRSLESLTEEERRTVEKNAQYGKYLETLDKAGERNHFDRASGTDLRDNTQEALPWYVRLEVEAQDDVAPYQDAVRAALKEQGEAFALADIHFVDLLDGGEWHPQDVIRVSIPAVDLHGYGNMAIVHIRDDGALEFLEGHLSGSAIEFDTDEFSVYGIAGFSGSLEELMADEPQVKWWLYAVPGAVAAALLVLVLILGRKRER